MAFVNTAVQQYLMKFVMNLMLIWNAFSDDRYACEICV
jgi:hypothetical protein